MEFPVRKILLSFLFILFVNFFGFGQNEPCAPNQRFCNGACREGKECAGPGPPPPGLVVPIDSNISFLLISGMGLGIFYLVSLRRKVTARLI